MRKVAVPALLIALAALAALAAAGVAAGGPATVPGCSAGNLHLVHSGQLTIGTDNPAYPPWFGGGTPKGSKWKISDPATGKGFESAVAYAVAKTVGFSRDDVHWIYTPFSKSYAPGTKAFDFDINEVSFTTARAKVVDFSNS